MLEEKKKREKESEDNIFEYKNTYLYEYEIELTVKDRVNKVLLIFTPQCCSVSSIWTTVPSMEDKLNTIFLGIPTQIIYIMY